MWNVEPKVTDRREVMWNLELVGFTDYIIMNYSMKNFMTNDKSAHAKGVLNDKR